MTLRELFEDIENKERDTYIVTVKYKYDFEKSYTIENHILEYDSKNDIYCWQNDWYEGQTDIEVVGYMPLGDVDTTKCPSAAKEEMTQKQKIFKALAEDRNNYVRECHIRVEKEWGKVDGADYMLQRVLDILRCEEVCSECGAVEFSKSNYCPKCGTKMAESEE